VLLTANGKPLTLCLAAADAEAFTDGRADGLAIRFPNIGCAIRPVGYDLFLFFIFRA
jgi:hypothetical protein